MNETLTIFSERVDDIPLLLAQMARMGVQPLLDTHFPHAWQLAGAQPGLGDRHLVDPYPLASGSSAESRGAVGGETAPHAAGVHQPTPPSAGRQR